MMNVTQLALRSPLAVALLSLAITFAVLAAVLSENRMIFGLVAVTNFFASIAFFLKGRASDDKPPN